MEHRIFRAVKLHGRILYMECVCQDTAVKTWDMYNTEQTVKHAVHGGCDDR